MNSLIISNAVNNLAYSLVEKRGHAFALGYFEAIVKDILTSSDSENAEYFVDSIKKHIKFVEDSIEKID